jgi:hypothetical protein
MVGPLRAGAVYFPLASIVPAAAPSWTTQDTPVDCPLLAPLTVAAKVNVSPGASTTLDADNES